MGLDGGGLVERDLGNDATGSLFQVGHFRGYGLTNWLSLYGKIGAAYLDIDDPSIRKTNSASTKNRFGVNVLVDIQAKVKIWEHATRGWEWDGSLQYVDIRRRHKGKNEGRWHEWQFGSTVAKSFGRVKPYVGAKISLIDMHFKVRENGNLIKQGRYNDEGIGPVVGTDIYFGEAEDVILNVETSYVNGADVSVAVSYTF